MALESIVTDALALPENAIGYFVSRRLSELYPSMSIVEGAESSFDPDEHARDGHARINLSKALHSRVRTVWSGAEYCLTYQVESALIDVDWRGETLQVLFITWSEGGCQSRAYWIIAESRQTGETYLKEVCDWCSEVRGEVLVFDGGYWYKSEDLFNEIKTATFDNLVLPGSRRQEIQDDFSRFFASRDVYEKLGIPWKRGVLLIGPPGNGKTHTVKALANWLDKPCLYVKSFANRYRTEQDCMRDMFDRARKTEPCLLVLEDIDSLLTDRNRSFFLNEMDGFASNTGVVVLATTNHPERLDPAILERPSRFDRKYYFELPEIAERREYVARWSARLEPALRLTEAGVDCIASMTEDFSFAYLKELFLSSMMKWMDRAVPGSMDAVMSDQVEALRAQMIAASNLHPAVEGRDDQEPDDDREEW